MPTGFWKALFRPGPLSGATLEYARGWEVSTPPRPIRLASALRVLPSEQGVVALEGVSIHPEVKRTLQPYLIVPALEIRGSPTSESPAIVIGLIVMGIVTE